VVKRKKVGNLLAVAGARPERTVKRITQAGKADARELGGLDARADFLIMASIRSALIIIIIIIIIGGVVAGPAAATAASTRSWAH
jgi:hypothetical protein